MGKMTTGLLKYAAKKEEKAREAESNLLEIQENYGYICEVHGSLNECFEIIENGALEKGSVIVTNRRGTLVLSTKPLTQKQLQKCAKAQKVYDKYKEYL